MASKILRSKLPVVTIFTIYEDCTVVGATGHLLDYWKRRLGHIPYNFVQVLDHQMSESIAQLQEAEILLTDPDLIGKFLHQLPKTKWIQGTFAGVDKLFKDIDPKAPPPPFIYTRLGHGLKDRMAEYVIGQMIAHERHFHELKKFQEQKIWELRNYRLLRLLTVGIIGLGDIGEEIARLCKAFGMRVWGLGRRDRPLEERSKNVDEYRPLSGLAELLADCDYIVNVLPQTPATDDLLSGDVLSSCTKQPVFVNVGRGNVISEKTILNALDKQWISHAILDVFQTEPLPTSSPLWSSPKVTITAHNAADVHPEMIMDIMEKNYQRYITGQPLLSQVDWQKGY